MPRTWKHMPGDDIGKTNQAFVASRAMVFR
jgi:hypothetical protein